MTHILHHSTTFHHLLLLETGFGGQQGLAAHLVPPHAASSHSVVGPGAEKTTLGERSELCQVRGD